MLIYVDDVTAFSRPSKQRFFSERSLVKIKNVLLLRPYTTRGHNNNSRVFKTGNINNQVFKTRNINDHVFKTPNIDGRVFKIKRLRRELKTLATANFKDFFLFVRLVIEFIWLSFKAIL